MATCIYSYLLDTEGYLYLFMMKHLQIHTHEEPNRKNNTLATEKRINLSFIFIRNAAEDFICYRRGLYLLLLRILFLAADFSIVRVGEQDQITLNRGG